MSKYLRRVGTVKLKFQFELVVRSLRLSLPTSGDAAVAVKWVRGPRTASTAPARGTNGVFVWAVTEDSAKPLVLVCTLYQDKKNGQVQRKKSRLVLKMLPEGAAAGASASSGAWAKAATVGHVEMDLGQFAAPQPQSFDLEMPLAKCPDKRARLSFTVRSRWLRELGADDESASMISDLSTLDVHDDEDDEQMRELAAQVRAQNEGMHQRRQAEAEAAAKAKAGAAAGDEEKAPLPGVHEEDEEEEGEEVANAGPPGEEKAAAAPPEPARVATPAEAVTEATVRRLEAENERLRESLSEQQRGSAYHVQMIENLQLQQREAEALRSEELEVVRNEADRVRAELERSQAARREAEAEAALARSAEADRLAATVALAAAEGRAVELHNRASAAESAAAEAERRADTLARRSEEHYHRAEGLENRVAQLESEAAGQIHDADEDGSAASAAAASLVLAEAEAGREARRADEAEARAAQLEERAAALELAVAETSGAREAAAASAAAALASADVARREAAAVAAERDGLLERSRAAEGRAAEALERASRVEQVAAREREMREAAAARAEAALARVAELERRSESRASLAGDAGGGGAGAGASSEEVEALRAELAAQAALAAERAEDARAVEEDRDQLRLRVRALDSELQTRRGAAAPGPHYFRLPARRPHAEPTRAELAAASGSAEVHYLRQVNTEMGQAWHALCGKTVFIDAEGRVSHTVDGDLALLTEAEVRAGYEDRVRFYEQQLEQAEETLELSKSAWNATNRILQAQVAALEERASVFENEAYVAGDQASRTVRVARRTQHKIEKLSEYVNRCEVQLVQAKVRLCNTVDQLNTLEYENNVLRDVMGRAEADRALAERPQPQRADAPEAGGAWDARPGRPLYLMQMQEDQAAQGRAAGETFHDKSVRLPAETDRVEPSS